MIGYVNCSTQHATHFRGIAQDEIAPWDDYHEWAKRHGLSSPCVQPLRAVEVTNGTIPASEVVPGMILVDSNSGETVQVQDVVAHAEEDAVTIEGRFITGSDRSWGVTTGAEFPMAVA